MSSVNTGVSMKVSFIRKGYANDAHKSMTYANQKPGSKLGSPITPQLNLAMKVVVMGGLEPPTCGL